MSFISIVILLFFVFDPLGNIPFFISALKGVPAERKNRVVLRECLIAFGVLIVFAFIGEQFLGLLHISEISLKIAGGIILFLIAIRMIFPPKEGYWGESDSKEPFIFPLAIPLVAGPSALATVLLLVSRESTRLFEIIGAVGVAMAISTVVLLLATPITKLLGAACISAIERLMGLILTTIAVEMFLQGVKNYLNAA